MKESIKCLIEARLEKTKNFRKAILNDADMSGGDFHGICLVEAELDGTNFTDSNLAFSFIERAKMSNVILIRTNLKNTLLNKCDLTNADMREANLKSSDLQFVCLFGTDLRGVKFDKNTDFKHAQFDENTKMDDDLRAFITAQRM